MGAARRPAANYKVLLTDNQIDCDLKVREGGAKVICDLLLTRWPRQRVGRSEIMAHIVLGEDVKHEVGIASIPDLLVEAAYESLVFLR
jgi:hypothetical protein